MTPSVLPAVLPAIPTAERPTLDQIQAIGATLDANQYRIVRLAAEYDTSLEWRRVGYPNAAKAIAAVLDIHVGTAREWIRVGHTLDSLPTIHEAFASGDLSYAKTRIVTRWADPDNEAELLELAEACTSDRLTTAIAKHLAAEEPDTERDRRLHDFRSVTVRTAPDGTVIIHAVLPPDVAKPIAAALDTIVQQVAATPAPPTTDSDASTDASTDAPGPSMAAQLRELKQRWQPADDGLTPSLNQQRADALILLFLGKNVQLTTEVIIHIRGDGNTFNDGTPITTNAITRQLPHAYLRAMIHDTEGNPINASHRRRHPTTRQQRVVSEAHNHECIDCHTTELLELDHNPSYALTRRTVTTELEPRCTSCHRARHQRERLAA